MFGTWGVVRIVVYKGLALQAIDDNDVTMMAIVTTCLTAGAPPPSLVTSNRNRWGVVGGVAASQNKSTYRGARPRPAAGLFCCCCRAPGWARALVC